MLGPFSLVLRFDAAGIVSREITREGLLQGVLPTVLSPFSDGFVLMLGVAPVWYRAMRTRGMRFGAVGP